MIVGLSTGRFGSTFQICVRTSAAAPLTCAVRIVTVNERDGPSAVYIPRDRRVSPIHISTLPTTPITVSHGCFVSVRIRRPTADAPGQNRSATDWLITIAASVSPDENVRPLLSGMR